MILNEKLNVLSLILAKGLIKTTFFSEYFLF